MYVWTSSYVHISDCEHTIVLSNNVANQPKQFY